MYVLLFIPANIPAMCRAAQAKALGGPVTTPFLCNVLESYSVPGTGEVFSFTGKKKKLFR